MTLVPHIAPSLSPLIIVAVLVSFSHTAPLTSETTQKWKQDTFQDFERGIAEKITIRSDGKLFLAPRFRELLETPFSYLWDLVVDQQGNLFVSGGPDAAVLRIGADGKTTSFFNADRAEIHSLAVDSKNNIYAATSPHSKIYKITPSGEYSVFFEPKTNYVWDMAFDSKENLFLATGDKGLVYRVPPSGEGSVFFDTGETHVRAVILDKRNNVIVGTNPNGLIMRLSNFSQEKPKGFVFHQSPKKEITALRISSDGTIYAAGVGEKYSPTTSLSVPTISVTVNSSIPVSPVPAELNPHDSTIPKQTVMPTPPTSPAAPKVQLRGGSEVYQISSKGEPQVIWQSKTDFVYSIGLGHDQRPLIGTGNRGRLIRLDSSNEFSLLPRTSSSQITAMESGSDGTVFIATSGTGKVYAIGPQLETQGYFQSLPFDGKLFSQWGRIEWRGTTANASQIEISTRSGNSRDTTQNWSDWSSPVTSSEGEPSKSPSARFAQWKALFRAPTGINSPVLDSVSLFYLRKNVAPTITHIEMISPNYKFPNRPLTQIHQRQTLPPLGQPNSQAVEVKSPQIITPAKGYLGTRWLAKDENSDKLSFSVEIRGEHEVSWILLEDNVRSEFFSWDSSSFPDGWYQLRIKASDKLSNPVTRELTTFRLSKPFVIDNQSAKIGKLTGNLENEVISVQFHAVDTTTKIARAQYALDGGDWKSLQPVTALFDSKDLWFKFSIGPVKPGGHIVAVRVYDEYGNSVVERIIFR